MTTNLEQEHKDMVAQLAKPGEAILASLTPEKCHVLHMAVGVAGEAGELLGSNTKENTLEELGDIEFYLQALRVHFMPADYCPQRYLEYKITETHIPGWRYNEVVCFYAADLLDIIKKWVIYDKSIVDVADKIRNAIASLDFSLTQLYAHEGISREAALDHNIDKLLKGARARYKAGSYSDQQAQDRQDKAAGE